MNSFPLHPGKYALQAIPDPAEHAAHVRAGHPTANLAGVNGVVLLYQTQLLEYARSRYDTRPCPGWVRGHLDLAEDDGGTFALCGGFGLGAPAAALIVEQLAALGARRIITAGTAATLQPHLLPGALVVCNHALRDEGLSHHYLPPARSVAPSPALTKRLTDALTRAGAPSSLGPTWTIDAPYRETATEVAGYGAEGVLTVDMEAAAVFAVGLHRSLDVATVFAVADSLVERRPHTQSQNINTINALHTALTAAVEALGASATSERDPAAH
ncbi:nucleoside phosphorylase [Streptomyces sp. WM4235]|uniref:nucleoside phosphorylase n=1 Tax=Streptomyces sp. WM4235 TaxID=1415551 RepID=UPI0006B0570B|nr:nucleoside phosphorylase [Streptomyces sp. WM4235]